MTITATSTTIGDLTVYAIKFTKQEAPAVLEALIADNFTMGDIKNTLNAIDIADITELHVLGKLTSNFEINFRRALVEYLI